MMKRIGALLLAVLLALTCCACANEVAPESTDTPVTPDTRTPEEVAKTFLTAMYTNDAQTLVDHILPITYDGILWASGITADGYPDAKAAILAYFTQAFAEEPTAPNELTIETALHETYDRATYDANMHEYYPADQVIVKDEDLARIEELVFVKFSCDMTYLDGTDIHIPMSETALPVVKIDGRWYVDFLYSTMVIIPVEEEVGHAETPAPMQPE